MPGPAKKRNKGMIKAALMFMMLVASSTVISATSPISDDFNVPMDLLTQNNGPWSVLGAGSMDERADVIAAIDGKLTVIPQLFPQNAWFEDHYGPLVYQSVTGNFSVATRLRVISDSDYNSPPNQGYNAGGFVIRDAAGSHHNDENWVMYNMGGQGMNGVTYAREVKKTVQSVSNLFLTEQHELETYLLVCRIDQALYFYYWAPTIGNWREEHYYNQYHLDGIETTTWHNATNVTPELTVPGPQQATPLYFNHSGLPETVQVGIMGHTWSNGNTRADFDFVYFAPLPPTQKSECLQAFEDIDVIFRDGLE